MLLYEQLLPYQTPTPNMHTYAVREPSVDADDAGDADADCESAFARARARDSYTHASVVPNGNTDAHTHPTRGKRQTQTRASRQFASNASPLRFAAARVCVVPLRVCARVCPGWPRGWISSLFSARRAPSVHKAVAPPSECVCVCQLTWHVCGALALRAGQNSAHVCVKNARTSASRG